MCGIAGILSPDPAPRNRLERTLLAMARRGPDASAWVQHPFGDRTLSLLDSRLSILDLAERSDPPFEFEGTTLVFNGELYNYLEVRESLEAEGESFSTQGDTEVFHRVLQRWGIPGLEQCEGMWAFAFFDSKRKRLWLGRDRFGEKPLFWTQAGETLAFGSEPKFLFQLLGRDLPVCQRQVLRFLILGYKSLYKKGLTFFEGLEEVAPGQVLEVPLEGSPRSISYWNPRTRIEPDMTFSEAVQGTRERLIRSLEIRLRSDVPLAFCLSGGVDSNSLVSIAKRIFDYDVQGFTIQSDDPRYDETDQVESTVRKLGIRHTFLPVRSRGFLEDLKTLVRHHDAPVYTITYFVHWLLMGAIREKGYKVSISGTSADELFTGYYDHHNFYIASMQGDPDFPKFLANWEEKIAPIVRNPVLQDPLAFVKDPSRRDHIPLNQEEFLGFLRPELAERFRQEECFDEVEFSKDILRSRMLNELFHEATPVILHEDDSNAMYHSIENRSPFLDRPLFEFANSIPTRHLIQDGVAKAVLREAMRGIVPDPILDQVQKVGFNAPVQDLLDCNDPEVRAWLQKESPIFDYIDRGTLEALLDQPKLSNSFSKFLFSLVSVKTFLETRTG